MKTKKVLVYGGTGMLGSMVVDVLKNNDLIDLYATARLSVLTKAKVEINNVNWLEFDCNSNEVIKIDNFDYVINCIGMTKPYTHDNDQEEIIRAVKNNILFPYSLQQQISVTNTKVIQIATDCVYSGNKKFYTEFSPHDPVDVYGKTKSLGEIKSENFFNLRCSIIGPEAKNDDYLLTWFLNQKPGAEINGYINHNWNGITTLQFAKICRGIIINDFVDLPTVQHIVPDSVMTKAEMLHLFAECYNRKDIVINDIEAPKVVDRTLSTDYPTSCKTLWILAGYTKGVPTVEKMIKEMAEYNYNTDLRNVL